MPKINPNLLPGVPVRVIPVQAEIPGQGLFQIYLRQCDFSELLLIQGEASERWKRDREAGNWYPCVPPVAPSEALWSAVLPVLKLQCAADGEALPPEERYSEQELIPILGRVPEAFNAVTTAYVGIIEAVQGAATGNDLEGRAASPSAPASNMGSSTPT